MKCSLNIEDKDTLRIKRFKKAYPEAQDISNTTILGFIDAIKKITHTTKTNYNLKTSGIVFNS